MNFKQKIDHIVFDGVNEAFGQESMMEVMMRDEKEFENKIEAGVKWTKDQPEFIRELDEDEAVGYGLSRDETVYELVINKQHYLVTVGSRMYFNLNNNTYGAY